MCVAAQVAACHDVVELAQPTWPTTGTVVFATASAGEITRRWVFDAADVRRFPLEVDSVFVDDTPKLLTATHACPPATLGIDVSDDATASEVPHPALRGFDAQSLALDDTAPTWSAASAIAARDDDLASIAAGRLRFDEDRLCESLGASLSARPLPLPADTRAVGPAVRVDADRVVVLVLTSTGARALVVDARGEATSVRLTRTTTIPRARAFGPLLASDGRGRLVLADNRGRVAVGDLARGLVDDARLRLPKPRDLATWSQLLYVGDQLVLTDSGGQVFVAGESGWSAVSATTPFEGLSVGARPLDDRTLALIRAPDGAASTFLDLQTGRASRAVYFMAEPPLPADLITVDDGWFVFAHQLDFIGALATDPNCLAVRGVHGQVFRAETSPSGEIGSRSVVGSLERDLMYSAIERVDDERVVWGGSRSFLLCNEGILADGPPKLGVWHLLGPQCAYTGSALPPTGHARQIMPLGEGRALIRYESPSALLVVEVEGTRASCFDDTLSRRLRPTRGPTVD